MTLPQVYEIFGHWRRRPPLGEVARMIAIALGVKPGVVFPEASAPRAAAAPAPSRVRAAPDPAVPLPDPLPEHDRSVEAMVAMLGGQVPAGPRKDVSLERFIEKLTGAPV